MRTLAPQMLDEIQRQHGAESTLVLEVEWVPGGQKVMYSDKKIEGQNYPYPYINSVGSFNTSLQVTGAGESQEIAITLNDIDGTLKEIFESCDIHKRPVWVYQAFTGLHIDYKFLLFSGEINSPITWDEGDRTLTFSVLTREVDAEVAFTMEEGDFPQIPEEALGKVWPLVFGDVCNMQAVQIRAPRRGYLQSGEGISDFTIPNRLCQAKYIQCATESTGKATTIVATGSGYEEVDVDTYGPSLECVERRFETICALKDLYEQQKAYEHPTLTIRGGNDFPQGRPIRLNINGAIFKGTFSGETFTVTTRIHPDTNDVELIPCGPVTERAVGLIGAYQIGQWVASENGTHYYVPPENFDNEDCDALQTATRAYVGGPVASQKAFDDMPTSSFFWIPAGSEVYLEDEAEILFIASLIPGVINHVAAYRTQPSGRKLLMEVPADYYTVYETDYDAYTVMEIGMDRKLSQIDSKWDDDIYVSITSDIGGNPVDIIEWLIDTYTDLTYDAAAFADVKTKLANYPANFWVKEKKSVLTIISDIAYQSRCAIFVRNGVMYIKYLSETPTPVRMLTASDIVSGTFKVNLTETEDLVTKYDVEWQNGEAGIDSEDSPARKFAVRFNIPKYGLQEQSVQYYTQNIYSTILKSATFWLIRNSNSWQTLSFSCPLSMLDLDIFDCITINIPQFNANPVTCVITKITYNNQNNTIGIEAWTPIRSGENTEYHWAWPATTNSWDVWPSSSEEAYASSGYNMTVTPPVDHILAGGDTRDSTSVIVTAGDRFPSDADDTLPTVNCEISDTNEIEEPEPEFEAWELAKSVNREQMSTNLASGDPAAGTDSSNQEVRTACGKEQIGQISCIYEVTVTYITPQAVTSGHILGGCDGGPCTSNLQGGYPCYGPMSQFCHTFGAYFAASMFRQKIKAEIDAAKSNCGYFPMITQPYWVTTIKTIDAPPPFDGECEESPGDPDSPNQGEIYAPLEK